MSTKVNSVIIEPRHYCPTNIAEHYKFNDIQCPSCYGKGHHKSYKGYHGTNKESKSVTCERCEGKGKLMADVIIKWSADKEII